MENGIAIDTLHAQLLELSRREEYGFDMLRGQDWGKANSEKYNKMKSSFIRSMRMLAKKAPVKYYGGAYYMFNGDIRGGSEDSPGAGLPAASSRPDNGSDARNQHGDEQVIH